MKLDPKLSLYVLRSDSLKPNELYIAVNGTIVNNSLCDSCELQALCNKLFGVKGADCKIYEHGLRWQHVPREQVLLLKDLVKDA